MLQEGKESCQAVQEEACAAEQEVSLSRIVGMWQQGVWTRLEQTVGRKHLVVRALEGWATVDKVPDPVGLPRPSNLSCWALKILQHACCARAEAHLNTSIAGVIGAGISTSKHPKPATHSITIVKVGGKPWQCTWKNKAGGPAGGFAGQSLYRELKTLEIRGLHKWRAIRKTRGHKWGIEMAVDQTERSVDPTCDLDTSWGLIPPPPGLPKRGCLMLKDPTHQMTPGYITDDVLKLHQEMCVKTK